MESIIEDSYFCNLFKYVSEIGQGAFGKVYKCRNNLTSEEIAVKVLSKSGISKARGKQISTEAKILGQLNHPNIVKLKQFYESPMHYMLEMELLEGGTLDYKLSQHKFSDIECAKIMKEILSAVDYMHNHDIIHRDIKPENIMFAGETNEEVKLTDFGLSSQCTLDTGADDKCGTAIFMAPEQAVSRVYNKPVDIWSCGIVMYIIITGKHPLSTASDTISSYFAKLTDIEWKFPNQFSEMAQDLFRRLTRSDPLERYSADQALRHPWITRQTSVSPPMTYIEKLNYFNNKVKIRVILSAAFILASIMPETLHSTNDTHSEEEMPKINLKFSSVIIRSQHKKHASMIINNPRSPSPVMKKTVRLNSLRRRYPKLL